MRRLDIIVTVPETQEQFEMELMRVVGQQVLSRTPVNGGPIRRERQLVAHCPGVDDTWAILSSRKGQRVPVSIGLIGWPARVTSLLVGTSAQPAVPVQPRPAAPRAAAPAITAVAAPGPAIVRPSHVDFGAQFVYSIGTHAFPEQGYYEHEHFPWRWRVEGDVQVRFNPSATRRIETRADRNGRIQVTAFQTLGRAQISDHLRVGFEVEQPLLNSGDFQGSGPGEVTRAVFTRLLGHRLSARLTIGDSTELTSFFEQTDGFSLGIRGRLQPAIADFPILEKFILDQNGQPYEGDVRWRLGVTLEVRPTPEGWRLIFEWVRRGLIAAAQAAQRGARAAANLLVRAGSQAIDLAQAARLAITVWYGEALASGMLAALGFVFATASLAGGFAVYALFMIDDANQEGGRKYHLAEYASSFVRTIRGEAVAMEPGHQGRAAGIRDGNRLVESLGPERAAALLQQRYGESASQIMRVYNEIEDTRRAPAILTAQ